MEAGFTPPEDIYGIVLGGGDSSVGATVWLTHAVADGEELRVERVAPASDWFGVPSSQQETLSAVSAFLAGLPGRAAAGLNFPFGLPAAVVVEETWPAFLFELPAWANSPTDFQRRCRQRHLLQRRAAEGLVAESDEAADEGGSADCAPLLRETDRPVGSLSPYHDDIVAYTFHGLRDVLRPLVLSNAVAVPPLVQAADDDRATVLETYPGGTLGDLDFSAKGYRDSGERAEQVRRDILDDFEGLVSVPDDVRRDVGESPDALESLVAAYAVYRNTRSSGPASVTNGQRTVEGHIFI